MHVDWDCYALIVIEGDDHKRDILSVRSIDDPIAHGQWRLAGGPRKTEESDPMVTLVTRVGEQTGINLRKKSAISLLEHSEMRLTKAMGKPLARQLGLSLPQGKRYALTKSIRYYLVVLSMSEFISPTEPIHSRESDTYERELIYVKNIVQGNNFYKPHRTVISLMHLDAKA